MADFFYNTEEEYTEVPVENEEEGAYHSLVTPELSDNTNNGVAILRKDEYRVKNNNDPVPEKPHTCCKGWQCYVSSVGIQIKYMLLKIRGARLKYAKAIKTGCGKWEGELYWLFYIILPFEWMKDLYLVMTRKNLEGSSVRWGEIPTYLELWLLMYSVAT